MTKNKTTLLQITNNGMGQGDKELGLILINNYLKLIIDENAIPQFIVLYNGGVKLIRNNAQTIPTLNTLESKGVKVIACKTCLNHYSIADKMGAGIAGTMIDIIELQNVSDKIVTL